MTTGLETETPDQLIYRAMHIAGKQEHQPNDINELARIVAELGSRLKRIEAK